MQVTLNLLLTHQQRLPPNLLRKQYPLRNRTPKHQFASLKNQETNTAVSSDSEDPESSRPILSIEERSKNRELISGTLKTGQTKKPEQWFLRQ